MVLVDDSLVSFLPLPRCLPGQLLQKMIRWNLALEVKVVLLAVALVHQEFAALVIHRPVELESLLLEAALDRPRSAGQELLLAA